MISLKLSSQLERLYELEPEGRGQLTKKRKLLVWYQWIQPTAYSRRYRVKVTLKLLAPHPTVQVLEPNPIKLAGGKRSPHDYASKGICTPCLYYFNGLRSEWKPTLYLAETVIPWLSEWLYFWEIWHYSGEWEGGGSHVDEQTIKDMKLLWQGNTNLEKNVPFHMTK